MADRGERPGIYVGYMPMPARHARFVAVAAPALVLAMALVAGLVAALQRDPGSGVWDFGRQIEVTGVAFMEPYPMVLSESGEAWLVVEAGKFRAAERLGGFDGAGVLVRGFRLEREGRRMIELLPAGSGDEAIESADAAAGEAMRAEPRAVTVVGEIVDGKCFVGAMKPGDGKGHKACAILCIRGGLPALVAGDVPGSGGIFPLLRVGGTTALPERVLGMVAEPVRIEGVLSFERGVAVLDAAESGISRWRG